MELDWKADTRPLHQLIDSVRATNPAQRPDIADSWLLCALAERDLAPQRRLDRLLGENNVFDNDLFSFVTFRRRRYRPHDEG